MAEAVAEGVDKAGGEVDLVNVEDINNPADLKNYDGIIVGSPTYYGVLAAQVKELLDESIIIQEELEGKVGGAFSSCGIEGGGSESTVLSIVQALLVHGMIIHGFSGIGHYRALWTGINQST